jgi:hypothetical protein
LQALAEISRVVSATLDLATLYDTIYQQVGRVMDTTRFFIALYRPERGVFEIPYHREENELFVDQEVPLGSSVTSHVVMHGTALLFNSEDGYTRFAEDNDLPQLYLGEEGSQSMIFVPLNTEDGRIGALTVQSTEPNIYTSDDVRTLSVIASQAAVAIENARLFTAERDRVTELQTIQSLVHTLIGLHLVPDIAAAIDLELRRLIEYHACRLFMINEESENLVLLTGSADAPTLQLGEGIAGWIAQQGVSAVIPNTLEDPRLKYIVARLGGEEFCVLLPETSHRGVERAAERIRVVIAAAPMPSDIGLDGITVSFGVATLQEDDRSTEIFTRADAGLYQANHSGGNAVCVADPNGVHFLPAQERPERIPAVRTVPGS